MQSNKLIMPYYEITLYIEYYTFLSYFTFQGALDKLGVCDIKKARNSRKKE